MVEAMNVVSLVIARAGTNAEPFGDRSDELSSIVMARSAATWPSIWKISVDCRSRQASFAMTNMSSLARRLADCGNPRRALDGSPRRFAPRDDKQEGFICS